MNEIKTTNISKVNCLMRLIAWAAFVGALACFVLVALMAWKGGVWAKVIYAEKPLPHVACGFAGLFVWYLFRKGYRNTAGDWWRFVAKCVMLLISIGLSLFVGEVGLRAILKKQRDSNSLSHLKEMKSKGQKIPVHSSHPLAVIIEPVENERLVYALQANLNMDFGHKSLRTNSQGMRDSQEYSLEHPANTVRIVGIGDSGMFGWNVDQDQDYMSVLEKNLNAHTAGSHYEVLNMGVPGYNTQLEVECLRSKGLAYHPDIVILGWCENDFQLPFFLIEKESFNKWNMSYLYNLLFNRTHFSELVSGTSFRDQRDFNPEKVDENLKQGSDISGVEKAMGDLLALSKQNGFHVLVFGPMHQPVVYICKRVGIDYYNTLEKIATNEYPEAWAVHFMHPRPEGHRVLAEHMEKELSDRGWLTPSVAAPAP